MFRTTCSLNVLTLIVLYLFVSPIRSQDFAFPEREEEEASKRNGQNRKPVYIPGRCAENELLYPGDQTDDWICDCSPGHLFHPPTNKCYLAYKQGPCPTGRYLILPKDKVIPECSENPCRQDGNVLVNNRCYSLGQSGPCSQPELSYVVGVDTTTLEVSCIRLSIDLGTRFDDSQPIPNLDEAPLCAKGCRRHINGTCPTPKKVVTTTTTTSMPELFGIFTTGRPGSRLLNKLRA